MEYASLHYPLLKIKSKQDFMRISELRSKYPALDRVWRLPLNNVEWNRAIEAYGFRGHDGKVFPFAFL